MPNVTPDKIKHLANRYEEVCKHAKSSVGYSSPADSEFIQIIHKGGWTTLIDVERAAAIIDSLEHQVNGLAAANKALVDGARSALVKTASA